MHDLSRKLKRILITGLASATVLTAAVPASAGSLSKARARKAEAEESLDKVNKRISEITKRQEELQEEIDGLDSALVQIMVDIDTTNEDIKDKKHELAKAQHDLSLAKEDEKEHRESMSLRIRYMYENGDSGMMDAILGAKDFTDVLDKLEMYGAIYEEDRKALAEYQDILAEVGELYEQVETDESELEDMKDALEEQQAELEEQIALKSGESDDMDAELEEAETLASQYKETISEMSGVIAETSAVATDMTSASGTGAEVAAYAERFIGNPYVWGGTSLTNGCDCSGFVKSVYAHFGVSLPHSSSALRNVGYAVSQSDMRAGDIVCYEGHVGIYAGNGKIVCASNSKPYPAGGIKYANVNYRKIICVRRIFG